MMGQGTHIKEIVLHEFTTYDGKKFIYIIQAMEQNRSEKSG